MEDFRFYSPQWFIALPVVLLAVWWAWHPRRRATAIFSSLRDLKDLPVTLAQRIRRLLPVAYGVGVVLLIAALARPQTAKSESRIHTEGIAIEMALDISGSMEALDFPIDEKPGSRLNAVKYVTNEFVVGSRKSGLAGRPNDLLGVVTFAGFADSRCPLTLDHGALLNVVQEVHTPKPLRDRHGTVVNEQEYREEQMTAIGDGLSLALDRLRGVDAKSKIVILLSDGDNNAGVVDPEEAAKAAKGLGIKVYAIGIGHNGVAPYPMEDEFGQRILVQQRFRLDERLLTAIAETTDARYFNASNTETLLRVYREIDQLEKSKVEETRYTEYTELYPWLAFPGMALIVCVAFLGATRFRALP
jgi:Ca-activated chloride channel family protein